MPASSRKRAPASGGPPAATDQQPKRDLKSARAADLSSDDLAEQMAAAQELPGAGNDLGMQLLDSIDNIQDDELTIGELLDPEKSPGEGMGAKDSFGTLIPNGWGKAMAAHRGVTAYDNSSNRSICVTSEFGYKYQCVEYVNRFASKALGLGNMKGTGNAKDYDSARAGLTYVKNQPGPYLPQDGDILVFKGGAYGHVAVATSGGPGGVNFIQQNAGAATGKLSVSGSQGRYTVGSWGSQTLAGWQHAGPLKQPTVAPQQADPARPGPAPSGNGASYTVRPGDTLFAIAQRMLGDGRRYTEIANANGIRAPYVIHPNQALRMPGSAKAAPSSGGGGGGGGGKARTITVKPGDTLWGIAARELGNGARYTEIARMNGIANPSVISSGQVIKLPS